MVPAPKLLLSNQSVVMLSNAKLPWRSASCYCRLSCAVPGPNIAPGPSPGFKIESIFQSIVQSMVQSRVQLLHSPRTLARAGIVCVDLHLLPEILSWKMVTFLTSGHA